VVLLPWEQQLLVEVVLVMENVDQEHLPLYQPYHLVEQNFLKLLPSVSLQIIILRMRLFSNLMLLRCGVIRHG
jgi:UDP-N-acetylmuramate-alanine ligase